jgi:hypothetical protein
VAGQQVPAAATFKYEVIIAPPMTLACDAAQWSEWLARFSMMRKPARCKFLETVR